MPATGNLLDSVSPLPFSPPDEDVLLTRPETASFLRVSIPTLDRWVAVGIGPRWVRIGPKGRRYPLSALRAYVRQGEREVA